MCNKCGYTPCQCNKNHNCGCNKKENPCAKPCDPCKKQEKLKYCGKDIDCLGIKKGDDLSDTIETIAEASCPEINNPATYTMLQDIEPGVECELGGTWIRIYNLQTDNLIQESLICNGASFPCNCDLDFTITTPKEEDNICDQGSKKVTVTGGSGNYTYDWSILLSLHPGYILTGSGEDIVVVSGVPATTGDYVVLNLRVKDVLNPCCNFSTVVKVDIFVC